MVAWGSGVSSWVTVTVQAEWKHRCDDCISTCFPGSSAGFLELPLGCCVVMLLQALRAEPPCPCALAPNYTLARGPLLSTHCADPSATLDVFGALFETHSHPNQAKNTPSLFLLLLDPANPYRRLSLCCHVDKWCLSSDPVSCLPLVPHVKTMKDGTWGSHAASPLIYPPTTFPVMKGWVRTPPGMVGVLWWTLQAVSSTSWNPRSLVTPQSCFPWPTFQSVGLCRNIRKLIWSFSASRHGLLQRMAPLRRKHFGKLQSYFWLVPRLGGITGI